MQKYEEAMALISHAARYKMQLNSHKGDIESVPVDRLVQMAGMELTEMEKAAIAGDWEKVIVEAGDTMNFVVGVVQQAIVRYRERKVAVAEMTK